MSELESSNSLFQVFLHHLLGKRGKESSSILMPLLLVDSSLHQVIKMSIMITYFTTEGFWLQVMVGKTQKGNGEAEMHHPAPLFFPETETVCQLNVIKPKNDGGMKY